MRERLIAFVTGRPRTTLALIAAVTCLLAWQLPKIYSETDVKAFLPQGDQSLINLDLLEEIFGRPYLTQILVMREDDPRGIYNPESLSLISRICDWLQTRKEFETSRNSDLRSLATVNNITGDESGMVVEPFMEVPPAGDEEASAIRHAVEDNEVYVGMLVAADGKGASIIVRESEYGMQHRAETYYALRDYLASLSAEGHPERFFITGRPVIQGLFGIYIAEEARSMMPYVLALLILFLFLSFRTLRGVVLPVLVITATEVWMLGFLALWGHPMYTVTSILPILIVSIAVAASIHVLARYYEAMEGLSAQGSRAIVEHTMREIGVPVLMTSLTTAAGFLAMTSSKQVPMADFGVIAAVGICSAFVITMTVVPAALVLLPLRRPRALASLTRGGELPLGWMLARSTAAVDRRARSTLLVFAAFLMLGVGGILRLDTDSSLVSQFPPGHPIRIADQIANEHFNGGTLLDVIIDGLVPGAIKNPEILRRIDRLQSDLEELEGVGDTFSMAELVKRMNLVMNENRREELRIPDSPDLVAQYLLLYSISGDPGDFEDLVDYDYRYAHVFVFLRDSHTHLARRVERRVHEWSAQWFPPGGDPPAEVRLAGTADISLHLERYVTVSQIVTIVICLPVLLVLMRIEFGSWKTSVLAVLPVSLAIAGIYGSMGWAGIPTDIGTTVLGGMSLGIGIDFAIHYLHRYLEARRAGSDHEEAIHETAVTVGRALFYNTVVLMAGFLVLLNARMYPNVKLGALVSTTMALCYLATIYLYPAVLRVVSIEPQRRS